MKRPDSHQNKCGFTLIELLVVIAIVAILAANGIAQNELKNPGSNSAGVLAVSGGQRAEIIRADCIQGRRMVCGKILRVLPDGFVVDSGYTDLSRPALETSWLVPGSVTASRPASLIESSQPGSPCVGVIFLSDVPRLRGAKAKPKQYDYVLLLAYPAGQSTYTSVGNVRKTVRHFCADIIKAVNLNIAHDKESDKLQPSK